MASATPGVPQVPLLDDDTIAFGEEDNVSKQFVSRLSSGFTSGIFYIHNHLWGFPDHVTGRIRAHCITVGRHPYIVFFHLAFRSSAIVVYILCGLFSDSFIASFVIVILLLSADFWTVKNISGRLLVGLRWWNYVDDDGKSHWIFEANQNRINSHESRLFWLGLILCPITWSVFSIVCLFRLNFKWLLLVLIALTLNGANLYGYIKCKFGAKQNLTSATSDFVKNQLFQNAASYMFARPAQPAPSTQPTRVV